nr:immunoglobulin light chain junction region [Macaca mulatta]
FQQGNSNPPTF